MRRFKPGKNCCDPCTIFKDLFDSDDLAGAWTVDSGSWAISTSALETISSASGQRIIANATGTHNHGLVTVNGTANAAAGVLRIFGSYTNSSNYLWVELDNAAQTISLKKKVSGTDTTLRTMSSSLSPGTTWTIYLCWDGTYATAAVYDGTNKLAVIRESYTGAGNRAGVGGDPTADTGAAIVVYDFLFQYLGADVATCPPCKAPVIGFDSSIWSTVQGVTNLPCIGGVAADISLLDSIDYLFMGQIGPYAVDFCNDTNDDHVIIFDSGDWAAIGDWLSAGGRLYIAADWGGDSNAAGGNGCFSDISNLNSFLGSVGGGLSYSGGDYNSTTPMASSTYYSAGAAAIASGINYPGSRFGVVSGGTTLWLGPAGTVNDGNGLTAAVINTVGDGFIVLVGDANPLDASPGGFEEFIRRFLSYPASMVL